MVENKREMYLFILKSMCNASLVLQNYCKSVQLGHMTPYK